RAARHRLEKRHPHQRPADRRTGHPEVRRRDPHLQPAVHLSHPLRRPRRRPGPRHPVHVGPRPTTVTAPANPLKEGSQPGGTMTPKRVVLAGAVVAALAGVAVLSKESPSAGEQMAASASELLGSLNDDQRSRALFAFDDKERTNWNFVPLQDKKKPLRKGL